MSLFIRGHSTTSWLVHLRISPLGTESIVSEASPHSRLPKSAHGIFDRPPVGTCRSRLLGQQEVDVVWVCRDNGAAVGIGDVAMQPLNYSTTVSFVTHVLPNRGSRRTLRAFASTQGRNLSSSIANSRLIVSGLPQRVIFEGLRKANNMSHSD
jgi:hypothetical protein